MHGVLDVFRQILPHVAVQTDERKQIQKIASVVHIRLRHLHLAGFLRQGIFHPLLHVLRQQRRHQFGHRCGQRSSDDPGTGQRHHDGQKSGKRAEQSPLGTACGKAQQDNRRSDIYYNSCRHSCLPFLL